MKNAAMVAMVLAGCAPQVQFDDYCSELLRAQCEKEQRCGRTSSQVDCTQYEGGTECLGRSDVDAVRKSFDGTAAHQCVTAVKTEACDEFTGASSTSRAACASITIPTEKPDKCGGCDAGKVCVPTGAECACMEWPRWTELPDTGEACTSPLTDGAGCKRGNYCTSSDGICARNAEEGASCSGVPCVETARCANNVCVPRSDVGGTCESWFHCLGGLGCIDGTCQLQRSVGTSCTNEAQCLSGRCFEGQCTSLRSVGATCDNYNGQCIATAACINGLCVAKAQPGEACGEAGCLSTQCINGTCAPPPVSCY